MASDAIDYIRTLIRRGLAYELDGYVVFDWGAVPPKTAYPDPAPVFYPIRDSAPPAGGPRLAARVQARVQGSL